MPHIPFHPAIGFGELMQGWHVVPQNPIRDAGTPLVPSVQATAPNRVLRTPRLAELMPAAYSLPQNPLRAALGVGRIGCGGGCGCGGQANYTLNGLGQLDTSSIGGFLSSVPTWLTEPSSIFPAVSNWLLFGGLIIAADLYFGKHHR